MISGDTWEVAMYLLLSGVVFVVWSFMWAGSPRVWPWFFGVAALANAAVIVVMVVLTPPAPADCDIMCFPWTATWIIGAVGGLVTCCLLAGVTAAIRAFSSGGSPSGQGGGLPDGEQSKR